MVLKNDWDTDTGGPLQRVPVHLQTAGEPNGVNICIVIKSASFTSINQEGSSEHFHKNHQVNKDELNDPEVLPPKHGSFVDNISS